MNKRAIVAGCLVLALLISGTAVALVLIPDASGYAVVSSADFFARPLCAPTSAARGTPLAGPGATVQNTVRASVSRQAASAQSSAAQAAPAAKYPAAPGSKVFEKNNGGASGLVDYSNISDGYFVASLKFTSNGKVRLEKSDKRKMDYDISGGGVETTYSINLGSGTYTAGIFVGVGGKWGQLVSGKLGDVKLTSELNPFLYPNLYVNYDAKSKAVAKAAELCKEAANDVERVKAVYAWITSNVEYDTKKASDLAGKPLSLSTLPQPDSTLDSLSGICFDYAALFAAMCRSQGIPTRLVIGNVTLPNKTEYHAWNEVYLQNEGWVTVGISVSKSGWSLLDSTLGASVPDKEMAALVDPSNKKYTVDGDKRY